MPMTFMVRQMVPELITKHEHPLPIGRPRSITEEMIDTALRMREDGATWDNIGAAVGASGPGIKYAIQRRSGEEN